MVDGQARAELAELAQALIAGVISTDQFEGRLPRSPDPAIREIFLKGFSPLYNETADNYLIGENGLSSGELAFASRCILFLRTSQPYAWPSRSRSDVFWRGLLNAITLGAFGRSAQRKLRATGDVDAWPFLSMQDFIQATRPSPEAGRGTSTG